MPRECLLNVKTFNIRFYFLKLIFMHICVYKHTYLNMYACVHTFFCLKNILRWWVEHLE